MLFPAPDVYTASAPAATTVPATPTAVPSAAATGTAAISLDDRLREVEANLIAWALKASRGNKSKAAELLQIKRSTLGDRINRCGLGREAGPGRETSAETGGRQ